MEKKENIRRTRNRRRMKRIIKKFIFLSSSFNEPRSQAWKLFSRTINALDSNDPDPVNKSICSNRKESIFQGRYGVESWPFVRRFVELAGRERVFAKEEGLHGNLERFENCRPIEPSLTLGSKLEDSSLYR